MSSPLDQLSFSRKATAQQRRLPLPLYPVPFQSLQTAHYAHLQMPANCLCIKECYF